MRLSVVYQKVHRGNLKNMSENARNKCIISNAPTTGDKNGNKTTSSTSTSGKASAVASDAMIIESQPFGPIKSRIRQMEDESSINTIKLDALKQSKNEDNHLKKSAQNGNGNHGKADGVDNAPNPVSVDQTPLPPTADCDVDSNKLAQGVGAVAVPTPLPRTSRTNSMTDQSSSEESSSAAGSPRPSPMPRVTIGSGYKVPDRVEKENERAFVLSMVALFARFSICLYIDTI